MPIILPGNDAPALPTSATSPDQRVTVSAVPSGVRLDGGGAVFDTLGVHQVRILRNGEPVYGCDPLPVVGGTFVAYDMFAPYGKPSTWVVEYYTANGSLHSASEPVTLDLPDLYHETGGDCWLKSAYGGQDAILLDLVSEFPVSTASASSTLERAFGSPLAGGSYESHVLEKEEWVVQTTTLADRDRLRRTLYGGLLYRQVSSWYGYADCWMLYDGHQETFPETFDATEEWRWTKITLQPVVPPATRNSPPMSPGRVYADTILSGYTYADSSSTWASYAERSASL